MPGAVYLVHDSNAHGSEIKKTRPWVLVGAHALNRARKTVIAIPLSTKVKAIADLSVAVCIKNVPSCAVLDQIRAIDKNRLLRFEGTVTVAQLQEITQGLRYILGI